MPANGRWDLTRHKGLGTELFPSRLTFLLQKSLLHSKVLGKMILPRNIYYISLYCYDLYLVLAYTTPISCKAEISALSKVPFL
jgi:hypothetical protein